MFSKLLLLHRGISTHAPARGATLFIQGFGSVELFQPTLPRGERLHKRNTSVLITEISTHAPARGATKCLCFSKSIYLFQPTLPRGERRRGSAKPLLLIYFNPRSREGSDNLSKLEIIADKISTHAPARGATCCILLRFVNKRYFNPRSREGSDN